MHVQLSLRVFFPPFQYPFLLPCSLFLFSQILTRCNFTKPTFSSNVRECLRSDSWMISPLFIRFARHFLDVFVDIRPSCPCSCFKRRVAKRTFMIASNREVFNIH